MYYPYLRARQFELISIRELVLNNVLQGKVVPVLEPIKEEVNNLNLAHGVFLEKNFYPYLIVNPQSGKVRGDSNYFLDYLHEMSECNFKRAFVYSDNKEFIENSIVEYGIDDCMVIGLDSFVNEEGFKQLCLLPQISSIMLLDPGKYRGLDRFIKSLGKIYIRLDDLFEKQTRNADFLEIPAHKFSEEHLYYNSENYQGFSDFTILPSEFIDGGSTPRAVVIDHLQEGLNKLDV